MKLALNLASRTYLNRRALYGFYAVFGGLLLILLVIGIGLLVSGQAQIKKIRANLSELGREAAAAEKTEGSSFTPVAYKELLQDISFANQVLAEDGFRWTRLLDRLEEVVPETVAISAIQPDYKEKSLKLNGLARNVEDLQKFLDNLIASEYFSDVYLLQQSRLKDTGSGNGVGAVSFSIVVRGAF